MQPLLSADETELLNEGRQEDGKSASVRHFSTLTTPLRKRKRPQLDLEGRLQEQVGITRQRRRVE